MEKTNPSYIIISPFVTSRVWSRIDYFLCCKMKKALQRPPCISWCLMSVTNKILSITIVTVILSFYSALHSNMATQCMSYWYYTVGLIQLVASFKTTQSKAVLSLTTSVWHHDRNQESLTFSVSWSLTLLEKQSMVCLTALDPTDSLKASRTK